MQAHAELSKKIKELEDKVEKSPAAEGCALYVINKNPVLPQDLRDKREAYIYNEQTKQLSYLPLKGPEEVVTTFSAAALTKFDNDLAATMKGRTVKRLTDAEVDSLITANTVDPLTYPNGHTPPPMAWTVANGITMSYNEGELAQFHEKEMKPDLLALVGTQGNTMVPLLPGAPLGAVAPTLQAYVEEVEMDLYERFEQIHNLRKTALFENKWPNEKNLIADIQKGFIARIDKMAEQSRGDLNQEQSFLLGAVLGLPGQPPTSADFQAELQGLQANAALNQNKINLITQFLKQPVVFKEQEQLQVLLRTEVAAQAAQPNAVALNARLQTAETHFDQAKQVEAIRVNAGTLMNKLSDSKLEELATAEQKWITDRLKNKEEMEILPMMIRQKLNKKGIPHMMPFYGAGVSPNEPPHLSGPGAYEFYGADPASMKEMKNFPRRILVDTNGNRAMAYYDHQLERRNIMVVTPDMPWYKPWRMLQPSYNTYTDKGYAKAKSVEIDAYLAIGVETIPSPMKHYGGLEPKKNESRWMGFIDEALNRQYDFHVMDKLPANKALLKKNSYVITTKESGGYALYHIDAKGSANEIVRGSALKSAILPWHSFSLNTHNVGNDTKWKFTADQFYQLDDLMLSTAKAKLSANPNDPTVSWATKNANGDLVNVAQAVLRIDPAASDQALAQNGFDKSLSDEGLARVLKGIETVNRAYSNTVDLNNKNALTQPNIISTSNPNTAPSLITANTNTAASTISATLPSAPLVSVNLNNTNPPPPPIAVNLNTNLSANALVHSDPDALPDLGVSVTNPLNTATTTTNTTLVSGDPNALPDLGVSVTSPLNTAATTTNTTLVSGDPNAVLDRGATVTNPLSTATTTTNTTLASGDHNALPPLRVQGHSISDQFQQQLKVGQLNDLLTRLNAAAPDNLIAATASVLRQIADIKGTHGGVAGFDKLLTDASDKGFAVMQELAEKYDKIAANPGDDDDKNMDRTLLIGDTTNLAGELARVVGDTHGQSAVLKEIAKGPADDQQRGKFFTDIAEEFPAAQQAAVNKPR